MKNFPDYTSHAVVACFACGRILGGEPKDTGTPTGRWALHCPRCKMLTHYDLVRDPDEVHDYRRENPRCE